MIDLLSRLDARTAAGLLADTAMHLEGFATESHALVEGQDAVEAAIVDDLRKSLNLQPEDFSERAVATLTDALDAQAEKLISGIDKPVNSARLGAEGLLSSDLYNVIFGDHLAKNFGKRWVIERELAEMTIRSPNRQEHVHTIEVEDKQSLVSLFARYFWHRFSAKNFWLLVVGSRQGTDLHVAQVWRLYTSDVDLSGCRSLLDAVRAFANTFGRKINIDGEESNFFLSAKKNSVRNALRQVQIAAKPGHVFTMTIFDQISTDGRFAYLVIPVDLTDYFRAVEKWKGWAKELLEELILDRPVSGAVAT